MAAVGLLTLHLHIPHSHSLKDKRKVLRALKDRLRPRSNVSVAEIEFQEKWQRSVVGIVTISETEAHAQEVLERVEQEAARLLGSDLTSSEIEFLLA